LLINNVMLSDVARPLSYKTRTTYFFKTKTDFFKDHQIINPRPQKTFPDRKNQANHAGNRKKPAYYRLSSQVLLHPKLGS